jgi:hypothetical protein
MTDLIQLTDAEIAGVSGGILNQSISIDASQSNSASVSQSATASNSGNVTASAAGYGSASQPRQALRQTILRWCPRGTPSERATANLSISTSDNLMLWPSALG